MCGQATIDRLLQGIELSSSVHGEHAVIFQMSVCANLCLDEVALDGMAIGEMNARGMMLKEKVSMYT